VTTFYGMVNSALLGTILLSGHVRAMEAVPSTTELLQLMENAEVKDAEKQSLVDLGDVMFHASCSQCHDTSRATSKRKSYDGWLATVRRMAAKEGATIPESQTVPIATYLASLNPVETNADQSADIPTIGEVLAASSVSLNGTVSLLWRKGDSRVENEGFFPDVWVGADWNPPDNPFSVQIMACTTCHADGSGSMNMELVEGYLRADLLHLATGESAVERTSDLKLDAKAGRFAVPFGAYSGMAHPGVYRTLTNPLMYNMGRRVGQYLPVLPMPYSDEGIDLHLGVPLSHYFLIQVDGYAVNGLQEGGFIPSRSWSDNNSNAALGGRIALRGPLMMIGGSYASGELQASGSPEKNYTLSGVDVTLHYKDWIRAYYEYARREEDTTTTLESCFSGQVVEIEGRLWNKPKVTLLVRYDTIRNPQTPGYYNKATIERFTWGPSMTLLGGSVVIVNHENWKHEAPLHNEDIFGVRWLVSF